MKKILALVLAGIMVLSMAACSSKDDSSTKDSSASQSTVSQATEATPTKTEPVEVSLAFWSIGQAIPEDGNKDPLLDFIQSKLNIKIKPVNITWDDYTQKIQIWAASNQLPDAFAIDVVGTSTLDEWVKQGIIKEIPDLSAYPNLKATIGTSAFDSYKYPVGDPNAKAYSIPRLNYRDPNWVINDYGVIVRKDWMAAKGWSEPTNFNEFSELMVKFAKEDPDGNGKADTIGLTAYNIESLGWLFNSFEPGMTSGSSKTMVRDASGKWTPAFTTEGALAGYKAVKNLFDIGGLDKDFATLKGEEGIDKFAAGKAGALAYGANYGSLVGINNKFAQLNPNYKFEDTFAVLKPFKNADGNYYRILSDPAWSETYINAKASDEKTAKILELFDYFFSEEGYNYTHFGMKDVDWKLDNSKVTVIPQTDASGKTITAFDKYPSIKLNSLAEWSGTGSYINPQLYPQIQAKSIEMRDWWLANAKVYETNLNVKFLNYPSKAQNVAEFKTDITRIVMSKDVEKAFNDVKSEYLKNGYESIIKEVNELTK